MQIAVCVCVFENVGVNCFMEIAHDRWVKSGSDVRRFFFSKPICYLFPTKQS